MDISPLLIRTPTVGELRVGWLSTNICSQMRDLAAQYAEPPEFAAQLLSRLIKEPSTTVDDIRRWTRAEIELIVTEWAKHPLTLKKDFTASGDILQSFMDEVTLRCYESQKKLEQIVQRSQPPEHYLRTMREAMRLQRYFRETSPHSSLQRLLEEQAKIQRAMAPLRDAMSIQAELYRRAEVLFSRLPSEEIYRIRELNSISRGLLAIDSPGFRESLRQMQLAQENWSTIQGALGGLRGIDVQALLAGYNTAGHLEDIEEDDDDAVVAGVSLDDAEILAFAVREEAGQSEIEARPDRLATDDLVRHFTNLGERVEHRLILMDAPPRLIARARELFRDVVTMLALLVAFGAYISSDAQHEERMDESQRQTTILKQIQETQSQLESQGEDRHLYLVTRRISLRAGPSTEFAVVDSLVPNMIVMEVERLGHWLQLQYVDPVEGGVKSAWVYKRHLLPIPPTHLEAPDSFIGMWSDREDMRDSTAWVRRTREAEWGV